MSRPQPTVLISIQFDDYNQTDILEADGIWTVLYKEQPINVRNISMHLEGLRAKYAKVTYPSPAPARLLAKKLNTKFNCTDFTAVKVL